MDDEYLQRWTWNERQAWLALVETHAYLFGALDRDLAADTDVDLARYQVLALLADAPGWRLPISELAARCGLTPGGIRRRFDALERDGLVERRREGRDPRWFAVLTLDGKRRLDAATPAYLESVRRHFFDQLDRDELRRLAAALERVARNIRVETGVPGSTDG
ncbi:MarR family winged helix-turn-helix transcriptional regulator [Dermatobacter hominis]|uniref:MarR family winged helix-turn-helix transcriptional regulator n=1 Tax=Dermatobacter hominis TaxID=2884263 RepID=UPI001D0FCA94|nr:MarR family transcriptional regulator [Dermatobacter hominis]UDY34946.1 MarR family transcriptional regulator [Dermatobacter hominis]